MLEAEGLDVQVIEARERVGGRVLSVRNVPGSPEAGGTAFGPGYARLVDAANRYGAGLIDVTPRLPFMRSRELVIGDQVVAQSDWPSHPANPFPDAQKDVMPWSYFRTMIARKNPLQTTDEWRDARHASYDVAVHDWLTGQGATNAAIELGFNTNLSFGTSAYDISLMMLFFSSSFAQTQAQLAPKDGPVTHTAVGGNQSIPEAMANALSKEIHFSRTVTGIRNESDQAEVHCADGTVYKADYVVCSLPFSVLRLLGMDPVFEGRQAEAVHTLKSQPMNQVHMVARKPFWEEDGLEPAMWTNGPIGNVVAEHKHPDDPAAVTSLTAWINGPNAIRLDQLPPGEASKLVVETIEKIRPAAKGQIEVAKYKSWTVDPFSAGDWAYWQPGQITNFANSMSQAHGRVHFCGEHTAVSNRGMEGAMESGERVALEIFSRL
jgi:monoamine oxidase